MNLDYQYLSQIAQSSANEAIKSSFTSYFKNYAFEELNRGVRLQDTWSIDLMCEYAEVVARKEIKRLIINIPPGLLKSTIWSAAMPSWILAKNPAQKIFGISNKDKLVTRNVNWTRRLMQTKKFANMFPDTQILKDTESFFTTTQGGERQGFATRGDVTGERANFLIFDDYLSVHMMQSESEVNRALRLFDEAFTSRINSEVEDVIVIIEQRLGINDLTGYLLRTRPGEYEHLELPAEFAEKKFFYIGNFKKEVKKGELLNPERLPKEVLDKKKNRVVDEETGIANGKLMYYAQYLQKPVAEGGNMVDMKWFQRYDLSMVSQMEFETIYVSCDTAQKTSEINDPSSFLKFGIKNNCIYLLDRYNKRATYGDTKANLLLFASKYPTANFLLIEDANTGSSLIQELPKECSYGIVPIKHGGIKKEIRFYNATGAMANGNIYLPHTATWLSDFEDELIQFPNGSHDDDCDALAQFLNYYKNNSINWSDMFSVF